MSKVKSDFSGHQRIQNSNETVQQDRTCIGLTSNSECNQPAFELFQQVQKGQTVESKNSWFFRPH